MGFQEREKEFEKPYFVHIFCLSGVNAKDFTQLVFTFEKEQLQGKDLAEVDALVNNR